MSYKPAITILGEEKGIRVESRLLEERIQQAVAEGYRSFEIHARGQHGIGGRLWQAGHEPIEIKITGISGQRLGSMGFPNTTIHNLGPASDDVGWLNGGAKIIVHGHAGNGIGNAMAQGKIYVGGDIGARGMTMTKHNPRFEPPELWVLGSVGDSFAEFMAGGVAVICGYGKESQENILGYGPCVGMVGGKIFFRGRQQGFSERDASLRKADDEEWLWLTTHLKDFLKAVEQPKILRQLTGDREEWRILAARKPHEKFGRPVRKVAEFVSEVWNRELGKGGLIGDLSDQDRSPIDVITTGELRRFVPLWENEQYLSPCQAHCPSGIPVQKRWELIRQGKMEEAVNLSLAYSPLPAVVCGYLCPNLCMDHCTRQTFHLPPVDTTVLGKASLKAQAPKPAKATGFKIAVIGGGAAGLSIAWQLWLKGHAPVIYDMNKSLGGKIASLIPRSRIPDDVLAHELLRVSEKIKRVHLNDRLTKEGFQQIKERHDFVVIATGAQKPRMIPVPGHERAIAALDFLRQSKQDKTKVGKSVVIIGAGNVGCDAASEAARLGAKTITLIDIQAPAAHGKERQQAEAAGARFLWPRFTKTITATGVELTNGELLPAETVIVSIGDQPDLDFLPPEIETVRGFIAVNENARTSDTHVYAVGDAVKLGLLTEAIGMGRKAATAIDAVLKGKEETFDQLPPIDPQRIKVEYYSPRVQVFDDPVSCAGQCASCGACRDCGICEAMCPQNAISRRAVAGERGYEYAVNAEHCIGCGFCAGACPCGIWRLTENESLE
jgi:NADPH-dependent glutamate synthase beta subunit-like oxidoreductase/glutamate synthase domain-containing protein 3/NAD-dependent dihydropyrimidine dehydrogenase PreA subunit